MLELKSFAIGLVSGLLITVPTIVAVFLEVHKFLK
jgi:hypothetical protein